MRDDTELIIDGLFSEGIIAYQRCLGHAVGDVVAALLLSQFWYWSKRQPKERKGWFYMTREQIFTETAMTRREQETARKRLKNLGVLNEARRGVPARIWYRIDRLAVIDLLRKQSKSQLVQTVPTRKAESFQLESTERTIKAVGKRLAISKTSLETSQTNSAAENPSAAALVEELVSHDLNRGDAIRFAHEKPEECKRQLAYLRFLIKRRFVFRTSKGGFLRTAIKEENGPPTGFEEARRAEVQSTIEKAHTSAEDALRALKQNSLRKTLAQLEIDQPDAFSAFLAYIEKKKLEAIDRPILKGAPEVRERLLQSFETEATRLTLLAEYLAVHPLS